MPGCGGCGFVFTSANSKFRGYDDVDSGKVFGFVLDKKSLRTLKRAIDFAIGEAD